MIKKFVEFISEKYEYRKLTDGKRKISYKFTNKDGINFVVDFKSLNNDDKYERVYYIVDENDNKTFNEVEVNDIFNIIKTITDITIRFLNKYHPTQLDIFHIPTFKEREETGEEEDSEYWKTHSTKRALAHKRFLEKSIPFTYKYNLEGSLSIIESKF